MAGWLPFFAFSFLLLSDDGVSQFEDGEREREEMRERRETTRTVLYLSYFSGLFSPPPVLLSFSFFFNSVFKAMIQFVFPFPCPFSFSRI